MVVIEQFVDMVLGTHYQRSDHAAESGACTTLDSVLGAAMAKPCLTRSRVGAESPFDIKAPKGDDQVSFSHSRCSL